ncbi:DUF998 domain-containing protein [Sulfitobacter aestuariivivens]|uniref:DUF998 domain-containing protein n=1 Tax=Sulfitobacter aestuariivivens TaxID=2766981 RepID=A0A927D3M5_9RHOB|nr:DUF998 domain-containing protein [Sulfitobacter aestuariivivens]MBD3664415.1 DUF998 domain-containing protein [Sulfitobacter aestuariivivens]
MPQDPHQFLAPGFLRLLAVVAVVGAVLAVAGNIVGSIVVPGHDFVADTISDLGAGRFEIIQDVALYGFAAALCALSLGAAHLHNGATRWSGLTLALILLAVCVIIIGARNEYGDGDNEGVVIHVYVVYALGALFAAVFALLALESPRFGDWLGWSSWTCFGLWIVGAPVFFMLPTEWDGLWERGLGLICVVWSILFGVALWRFAGRQQTGN